MGKKTFEEWLNYIREFSKECKMKMRQGNNWKERYSEAFAHAEWYWLAFLNGKNPRELYDYYYYAGDKKIEESPGEKALVEHCDSIKLMDNYYNIEDLAYDVAIKAYYRERQDKILNIKDQLFKIKNAYYPAETGVDDDMQMIKWMNAAIGSLEAIDNYLRAKEFTKVILSNIGRR